MLKLIMRQARTLLAALVLTLLCASLGGSLVQAQTDQSQDETTGGATERDSSAIARQLSNLDPLVRQQAAEELARLAAVDQLKMVAGYRLQEKNARVRLALDWALYRMGRTGSLFQLVRDLDSSRHEQAAGYLKQLDGPDPLYIFLDSVNDKTRPRLLEVLGQLGDANTIERLRPYLSSYDDKTASAAESAMRDINERLARPQAETQTRPRQVESKSETSP